MSRRRCGFTFIEACVSITIVTLLSAIVFPNVVRESSIRTHRLFKRELCSIAVEARNRAVEAKTTVSLSYNKQDKAVEVIEEDKNGASKPFSDLALPDELVTTQLYSDKDESPPDGWRVPFLPDGTTPGGGIEFKDGEEIYSFVVDRNTAVASVRPGKLPDFSNESWSAGGVQPRAQ